MTLEVLKGGVIVITARNIGADVLELLDLIDDLLAFLWVFDVLSHTLVEFGLIHLCACIPDYLDVAREVVRTIQAKKSWECLRPDDEKELHAEGIVPTFFFARSPDAPNTSGKGMSRGRGSKV